MVNAFFSNLNTRDGSNNLNPSLDCLDRLNGPTNALNSLDQSLDWPNQGLDPLDRSDCLDALDCPDGSGRPALPERAWTSPGSFSSSIGPDRLRPFRPARTMSPRAGLTVAWSAAEEKLSLVQLNACAKPEITVQQPQLMSTYLLTSPDPAAIAIHDLY